jgi:hypothetical protein
VSFGFEGAVLNIYTTLAVRLSHSGMFTRQALWKNAVTYKARVGGTCGMFLRELEEGHGELTLFFDQMASEETRYQFEEYIGAHLRHRALSESISRRREFICGECGTPLTETQITRRRERGFNWIACNVCGERISLLDREERLLASHPSLILGMDRAADAKRDLEVAESILHGTIVTHDPNEHIWRIIVTKRRRLYDLKEKQAYFGISTPPEIKLEIEDLQQEINDLLQIKRS